jgi:hypothetical protein
VISFANCKSAPLESRVTARYGRNMTVMIWIGAILSVAGLLGVLWCLRKAAWLRKAELDEANVRTELQKLIVAHMAAIGAAFLGMGLLITGLLLS